MEAKQIIQKDDAYCQIYGEKYIQKIDYLRKLIVEDETGENIFKVVNFEAGLGKSRYTDIIIKQYFDEWNFDRNFLIVKRFNDESYRSAETIEQDSFLRDHVVVITADNWQKWKKNVKELQSKQVIIISHKRYIDLCENDTERAIFTKDRHTLIIDEKVNFPIYTYSYQYYSDIRKYISYANAKLFDKACQALNEIAENPSTSCTRIYPKIEKELLQQFTDMMKDEIRNQHDLKIKRQLENFLDTVLLLYDKNVLALHNSKELYTLNRKHKHWGLKNNIILDASAGIDGVYEVHDKFKMQRQTRLIDHSESKFVHIKMNTSKSAIRANQKKYFEKIIEMIQERHVDGEKTLLVIHKKYADTLYGHMKKVFGDDVWREKEKETDHDYNEQSYAISWFGNLIGKNTFSDFDNVLILGTPNISNAHYLIHYMQYADKTLGKNSLQVDRTGKFKNSKFRAIQDGYIAAEIYQSIKRIQRNPKPKGKFYIVTKDEEIVHKVLGQIKNAKLTEIIEVKDEQKEKSATKEPTKIDQIVQYIHTLVKDGQKKIYKSDIQMQFGTIVWNRVKKHPQFQKLKLKEQQKYFVVP
ncbi:hypothetical protein [Anoxybacillus sp. ST4]|uniref:hypothetical protein n=1 Tax=Anoxybacillus sp. ST4 TaxID=2864181 RepID=UPI001C63C454|nr:hypothetical protein [Anoxybacillus sp. ST4]MBW7649808.1 hypothetical protein [Anoxybacillus sp. ST4]